MVSTIDTVLPKLDTMVGSAAVETNNLGIDLSSQDINGNIDGKDSDGMEKKPRCKLDVLVTVKKAQASNGLKHGDYRRYRQYCTRRVHRIRRATKLTQGRGRYAEKPVNAERAAKEPLALLIVLVLAERAWSAAMETKSGPVASPARGRRNILRKLKKAVAYAGKLKELCSEAAEEKTALEADAYAAWMEANLKLEQAEWPNALHCFQTSSKIYESMASALAHTGEDQVFRERVEEIGPLIRFCKYNMAKTSGSTESDVLLRDLAASGASGELLNEKINAALAESRKKAAQFFGKISWCGVEVPLRSEKVREEVLKATQETESFEKISPEEVTIDSYDNLFIAYNDAIRCVNSELEKYQTSSSTEVEGRKKELRSLIAYLSYKKLGHAVKRNLMLVESFAIKRSSKQEDFVRLYDNLVRNMDDMMGLEGVSDKPNIYKPLERRRSGFLAHRCFHLARCYAASGKLVEASALFDRVNYHASNGAETDNDELKDLVKRSRGMKSRAKAREFLRSSNLTEPFVGLDPRKPKMPKQGRDLMVDNLDSYSSFAGPSASGKAIIDFPPRLEIVPGKPVCFDLAVDSISFPWKKRQPTAKSSDNVTGEAPEKEKTTDTTRLGYLSRWFRGSG